MVRRKGLFIPLLLALGVAQTNAQEKDIDPKQALQSLLSNALKVTISARVLPPQDVEESAGIPRREETPVWNAESTKLTLPGRSIRVRLDGDNVRIYLICTPYVQESGEVLLLAQGQVWFSETTENEVKYSSTYYSIPVSFGEKVLFFPLGLSSEEGQQKDFFNIEMEIKIVPYQEGQ
jgi:hypothetical protein